MKKTILSILLCVTSGLFAIAQGPFTGKPQYSILTKQNGDTLGITTVELFPSIAPLHVANFDSLVNVSFFDSTAFHRVIPGFMIQGGDPNSRHGADSTWGFGDPSQPTVNAEFSAAKHVRGILSAARDNDTNSANSQFFICVATAAWLNGQYSVYGKVVSGMNYVDSIVNSPRDSIDKPLDKIEMYISYIGSNDSVPDAPVLNLPASGSYSAGTSKVLKWITQPGGILYHVEVATDSLFMNLVKNAESGSNTYTATGLTPLTKYYWRVRTNNGGHFSAYSEIWNFYISAVGLYEKHTNTTDIQVSPNPGKGIFTFSNTVAGSQLQIFDRQGKLFYETVSEEKTTVVNLYDLPKGIYFYKITGPDHVTQKGKLVLN